MIEKQKSDDGGPAFPVVESHPVHGSRIDFGMTLRDWFAGQVLCGFMADENVTFHRDGAENKIAAGCYAMADAMLKARQQ